MTQFKLNQRLTFAWIVNLALIVLTVIISVAGYKAYQRLNRMVGELQQNVEPNYNLLILKDISYFVNEMEREIDAYRSDLKADNMRNFNESLAGSQYLVDSLKSRYENPDLRAMCDSLSHYIKERAKVQTTLGVVSSDMLANTLDDLTKRIEEIPKALEAVDTTTKEEEKKKGFIGRIFSRKKKDVKDSLPTQSELLQIQNEIMDELAKAKEESSEKDAELRFQLSYLERESGIFQNKIIDIINTLETEELTESRNHVKDIQELANDTNREVVIFSALSSALLLITLISQLNYVGRSRKYQAALREAKKNAEELADAKEKFLANMSHEIRTPMNAISGFTNQLLKSTIDIEQKEQLTIIKSSSDHLLHLLNDILDFSKLQANKVSLEKETFDLPQLLHQSIRLFEDSAAEKGLKLKTEFDGIPQFIIGDAHRLRQIILNLLHNAIKFTDEGYVKLSAAIHMKTGSQVTLRIAVKDTGIGIAKDKQSRIFEEFEQANTSDQSKGTGLGLAISSMLVKLHNGKFQIESDLGKGTEMILHMPYEASDKKLNEEAEGTKSSIHLSGLTVLVADDEPFNLKLLETIFKNHDVVLTQAKDGTQALALLQAKAFDIAILDVKMPGMNGWEIVKQIRLEGGENSKVPMVALTATVSEQERADSLKAGFNRILRKPFDENELLELVSYETMQFKKGQNDASVKSIAFSEPEVAKFDLDGLRQMGDDDFVNEMVEIFKASSARSIENLKKAVKLKIRDSIRNEAHKMLPPARHLSAADLVKELETLQKKADKESFDELSLRIQKIETIYQSIREALKA